MERAAEPTDVFWENFSIDTVKRVKKSLLTYCITALLLAISFLISFLSSEIKSNLEYEASKNLVDSLGKHPNKSMQYFIIFLIVSINACFIALINFISGRIIRVLSSYEMHETYTNYHLSVSLKLTITRFINTGLIPLAVHYDTSDWFNTSGLSTDIIFITLAISFIAPLIDVFEPLWILNKIIL
jgi:hypothetical protein